MKQLFVVLFCTVFAVTSVNAKEEKKSKAKETITFQVDGMDCNNCVKKIEKNISFEKGVTDLKCDLATRTAEVSYRTDRTTPEKLVSAFEKIGMTAVAVEDDACCGENESCENKACCKTKKEGEKAENCCEGHEN